MLNSIKSKQRKILIEEEEVKERWAEYVEDNLGEVDMSDLVYEAEAITRKEIESVIKQLPKGKACGNDNIAAGLLQGMGDKGMEIMTSLINKIYRSGYIPEDFRKSIFVPLPKLVEPRSVVTLELLHYENYHILQRFCYI